MARIFCRVKIQNAAVTKTNLDYHGSLGIDKRILEEADIMPGETVLVADVDNGNRFVTYVIQEENSKEIAVYGAAAKLVETGHKLIIMAFEIKDKLSPGEKLPKVINLSF
ncbi:MAG: aspartate 1-decarboxylase [Planctomycetes bacterium]|nr:aspartate 1-decarboxylase [Planctomycetota bacterium]